MALSLKSLCVLFFGALVGLPTAIGAPAKDGDPLLVGTVWKGKLTQKGEYKGQGGVPPEFDCEFKITKRSGDKFEADLAEKTDGIKLTYLVRGTIKPAEKDKPEKGYKVEFESFSSKDVENVEAVIKVPYRGTLAGKSLKGTWKFPANDDGTTLEGGFEFELTKKEKE